MQELFMFNDGGGVTMDQKERGGVGEVGMVMDIARFD